MMILVSALAAYLAFNIIVFLIYSWDKKAARRGEWRVRESVLLWLAFLGGSLGAVLAQQLLRHKTRKQPFRTYLISIIILQVVLCGSVIMMPHWLEAALSIVH
ncbi:DUF1294 domain-containing protein [Rhizobium skierniewicense]|uniref:DUF1294 domain-containing protein n=1 Tax=Rhizobium skierniewicense TaxID=984260 RepID=UPI001572F7CA|nr:DUF1294 domain-containing protein [Rhizobium skierniewicense]NTF32052.1 DUF1294 domain-containing protein [Rhizobium skierniewicense]